MPLTGVGFTNELPAGVEIAGAHSSAGLGDGVATAPSGGNLVTLVGARVAAGASGSLTIPVVGMTAGGRTNEIGPVVAEQIGTMTPTSQATLEVRGPPAAFTLAATEATVEAVTLTAQIEPNGERTRYYFEYGTTPDYGISHAGRGIVGRDGASGGRAAGVRFELGRRLSLPGCGFECAGRRARK